MSEQEVKDQEDAEVDGLLNFADNLDYDKYMGDLEVNNMVSALKKRIDELRQEENWKNKIVDQWNAEDQVKKQERKALKLQKAEMDMDSRSDARSVASESKSVVSERTHKSINTLKEQEKKEKEGQGDWDKSTNGEKKPATLEERIAKHVADEILRNNTQIRQVHSNNSIRKMLEREAKKQMEEISGLKPPKIVNIKEYQPRYDEKDPSNLPYLHRNPAV